LSSARSLGTSLGPTPWHWNQPPADCAAIGRYFVMHVEIDGPANILK
jgi:hypothetical protein